MRWIVLGAALCAASGVARAEADLAVSAAADTIPPTIAAARVVYNVSDPEETAFLEFIFSEPVDWFHAISYSSYIDTNTGGTPLQGFWYPPDRTQVRFPSQFYGYGTCEQIKVIQVVDLAGNEIVDDGIGNVFTFHLQQVHLRGQMSDHMKAHDAPPHSFAVAGNAAPLKWAPICDVPMEDGDGDSTWTQVVFFDLPCTTAAGGPVAQDVEFLFSHKCNELEPIANRMLTLDLALNPDGRDTLDLWWADEVVTDVDSRPSRPVDASLESVFPNPARLETAVAFSLAERSRVVLSVVDVRGRVVRRLTDEVRSPGTHQVIWDGRTDRGIAAPSGVYFVRFDAGRGTSTRRIVLAR